MRIDLHTHTYEYSGCAFSHEESQIQAAINRGLDGIAITDHNTQRSELRLRKLNEQYAPFKIFTGIEISLADSGEDILVIGVPKLSEMKSYAWKYGELYEFVRERDGFIALPHPYRYENNVRTNVFDYKPDAIEIRSVNINQRNTTAIQALADSLGVRTIATSDSHHVSTIGMYHVILQNKVFTDAELVQELKNGRYEFGTF